MSQELEYVVTGALMMCDKGGAPMPFVGTSNVKVKINKCLVTTEADKAPIVNIPSFIICQITQQPCVPVPTMWKDTYPVKISGCKALLGKSTMQCGAGGKIEFLTSGQIPLPPEAKTEVKDMQDAAKDALKQAEMEEGAVGEASIVEGFIPFWGSGRDLVNDIQTGDTWGAVMNGGFLVLDCVSLGGASLVKGAGKGIIKGVSKAMGKGAVKGFTRNAFKALSKEALQKSLDNMALKLGRVCVTACFPSGTLVATENGLRPIEDIKMGDRVWAFDEEQGKIDLKPVIDLLSNEVEVLVKIYLDDDIITTTPEHPFYTNGEWKDAGELVPEDPLYQQDGGVGIVRKVEYITTSAAVYNFEVEGSHTFFVGKTSVLVHNTCANNIRKVLAQHYDDLGTKLPCFPADTLIHTPSGNTLIKDIKVGDTVYSFDVVRNSVRTNKVSKLFRNRTEFLVELKLGNTTFSTTRSHRFWVESKNAWIEAELLKEGMMIKTIHSDILPVETVRIKEGLTETYNFEVENDHNYFVDALGVLVHNANPSAFESTTKVYTEIYGIVEKGTNKTVYVGKTVQGQNTRFGQHMIEKSLDKNKFKIKRLDRGDWTAYETAVREQHYINLHGTKMQQGVSKVRNKINAISKRKFIKFYNLHKLC